MNISAVQASINTFLRRHRQSFANISSNQSKALELALIVGVTAHYKSNGYNVAVVNPRRTASVFRIKTSTRGDPWNFSHIRLEQHGHVYEVHANLVVRSAHDQGKYCVDLAVVKGGAVPTETRRVRGGKWEVLDNSDLVTFGEVKKLVVYPMLLAQFIGIVHEIKPVFLYGNRLPRGFRKGKHLPPVLASLGNFSSNSAVIVDAYSRRRFRVTIAENYDMRLAMLRGGRDSPFWARSNTF